MQKKNDLTLFFSLTLLITWFFGFIPVILNIQTTGFGTFLFYFGAGSPSVVALFFVFLTFTKKEKNDYFKRCFQMKRMTLKWTLFTIIFYTAVLLTSLFIGVELLGYEIPGMNWLKQMAVNPLYIILCLFFSLISGPLNEEFGWRGFALDKLFAKYGFQKGTIILGFIWTIWHLPWYFMPGQAQYELLKQSTFDAFLFIPSSIALSYVVSFVYVKTNRSVLAGAFVHMMSNFITSQMISPYSVDMSTVIRSISICFSVIVVLYTLFSNRFRQLYEDQLKNIQSLK